MRMSSGLQMPLRRLRRLEMSFEMKELLRRLPRLRMRLVMVAEFLRQQLML